MRSQISKTILSIALIVLALSFYSSSAYPQEKAKPKDAAKVPAKTAAVDPSQYVGAETCNTCHDDQYKSYHAGPHWQTMKDSRRGVAFQGCEGCHGPGKAHSEAPSKDNIVTFTDKNGIQASAYCLNCHQQTSDQSNFQRSAHHRSNVGCTNCHSVHAAKVSDALLKQSTPNLCFTCHMEVKSSFSKPFHHRVNEGLIKCTDCHDQHGGFLSRQLRSSASNDQVCFKCHAEKAGPFTFEHAPIKNEGCASCHTPHGSANPRMLKRASVNLLCLECHTLTTDSSAPAIPTFHNQATKYTACTMCHAQIHGSNASSYFFQ